MREPLRLLLIAEAAADPDPVLGESRRGGFAPGTLLRTVREVLDPAVGAAAPAVGPA